MAKAHVTTKTGAKIVIEGTPDEVVELVGRIEGGDSPRRVSRASSRVSSQAAGKTKTTPMSLIIDLIDGGFFKKPKGLSSIKSTLEEQGHYYPVTTLSPVVLRLVRKRQLRRIKDKKRWQYVG